MDGCPTCEELNRYAVGDLAADRFECVAAHVDGCAVCLSALARVRTAADAFVAAVTDAARAGDVDHTESPTPPVRVDVEAQLDAAVERIARHGVDPPLPHQVGDYRLIETVGAGGVGAVYRGV